MDYLGVYEDVLNMQDRAQAMGYDEDVEFVCLQNFIIECIQFRQDILLQTRIVAARICLA